MTTNRCTGEGKLNLKKGNKHSGKQKVFEGDRVTETSQQIAMQVYVFVEVLLSWTN